jgi:3-oxoacyl-[acyl-carrier protein] reductase
MGAELKDKVAVVTGGGRGIGLECALTLARLGANIVLADINRETLEQAAEEVNREGVEVLPVIADVSAVEEVDSLINSTLEKFAHLDILVNNAGITRDALLLRMKKEDWDLVHNINLNGTFNCTKSAARHMIKQRSGRIVNIASVIGVIGNAGQANYASSKAGVIGFTKAVARELAPRGVTVNAVAPGFIDTEMTRAIAEKAREELSSQIPLSRLGTPADVANCVKFLALPESDYITGQVIHVNGGMFM